MSDGEFGEAFEAMCESPDYDLYEPFEQHEDYEPNPYNGDDHDGGAHDHDGDDMLEVDDDRDLGDDREGDFDALDDDRDTDFDAVCFDD